MMKALILSLSLCVVLASCSSGGAKVDNSLTAANLKGSVKKVIETSYRARKRDGEFTRGRANPTYTIREYNDRGFLIKESKLYSDDNSLSSTYEYLYDYDDNLQRINIYDQEGGLISYTEVTELQGKQAIIKAKEYYGEGDDKILTGYTEMDWENYRVMAVRAFDENNNLKTTQTYYYGLQNDLGRLDIDNVEGRDYITTYTYPEYDRNKNWTRQIREYQDYPINEWTERVIEYY